MLLDSSKIPSHPVQSASRPHFDIPALQIQSVIAQHTDHLLLCHTRLSQLCCQQSWISTCDM